MRNFFRNFRNFRKIHLPALLLVGTAVSVATVAVPRPVQADSGLTAVLGGAALVGAVVYAHRPKAPPPYLPITQTVIYPASGAASFGSPDSPAIVYSLASPLPAQPAMLNPGDPAALQVASAPAAQPVAVAVPGGAAQVGTAP